MASRYNRLLHSGIREGAIDMQAVFPVITVNGQETSLISSLDRGFMYGDGIFETCRLMNGGIPLWRMHLARINRSCRQLRIPFDNNELNRYLSDIVSRSDVAQLENGIIKVIITRGVSGRGYSISQDPNTTYCIQAFQHTPVRSTAFQQGIRVRVCQYRLPLQPGLAGLKHLNRLDSIMARSEWTTEFDEGLVLDQQGNLIEATASNVWLVINGELITPDLRASGVAGIMRELIMDTLGPGLGLNSDCRSLTLDDVKNADEIFICNAVNGIIPVISIAENGSPYEKQVGSITQKLQSALLEHMNA